MCIRDRPLEAFDDDSCDEADFGLSLEAFDDDSCDEAPLDLDNDCESSEVVFGDPVGTGTGAGVPGDFFDEELEEDDCDESLFECIEDEED